MHACFHGGGSGRTKTISIIRDLTKNMKAMSLKVKAGGGGGHVRARRRRRKGKGAEAEEDLETEEKDVAASGSASASASAKIAPEEERGGKRQQAQKKCDKCRSALDDVAEEEEEEDDGSAAAAGVADRAAAEEGDGEWVAEPEPGVLMTLVPRPDGTNHLRKLRFREELFDGPRAAQRWWADNYDSIVELYSIVQSTTGGGSPNDNDDHDVCAEDDEPATPCQSEDDRHQKRRWQRLGCDSASTSGGPSSGSGSGSGSGGGSASTVGSPILGLVVATPNSSKTGKGPAQAQSHKHNCRPLHIN